MMLLSKNVPDLHLSSRHLVNQGELTLCDKDDFFKETSPDLVLDLVDPVSRISSFAHEPLLFRPCRRTVPPTTAAPAQVTAC